MAIGARNLHLLYIHCLCLLLRYMSTHRTTGHLQHKQDMIYLTDYLYIQNQQPKFTNKLMVEDLS
jgi:hypothetical protein